MIHAGLRKQGLRYGSAWISSTRSLSSKPPPSPLPPVNGEEGTSTPSAASPNAAKNVAKGKQNSTGSGSDKATVSSKSEGENDKLTCEGKSENGTSSTPLNKKRHSKKKQSQVQQQDQQPKASKYVAFEDFPKLPREISNASDSLLHQVRMNRNFFPSSNNESSKPSFAFKSDPTSNSTKPTSTEHIPYHDFNIPSHHLKGFHPFRSSSEADRILNELNDFSSVFPIELSDLNQPPHVEHPLKRSWSKMMPLNPGLHAISNEYLWELAPQGRFFKSPPFDAHTDSINGFKEWEEKMKSKVKLQMEKDLKEQKETNLALDEFNKHNSFLGPSVGGRKKLNRKLVKTFKKLQNEGKLGKKEGNDDD